MLFRSRTIRDSLIDNVLIDGVHYFRPFGGRKILFIWENIERDLMAAVGVSPISIPMANGGVCHG